MWTFLIGLCVAVALTVGAAALYWQAGVTVAEGYSPQQSVWLDNHASKTAEDVGYGTLEEDKEELARR